MGGIGQILGTFLAALLYPVEIVIRVLSVAFALMMTVVNVPFQILMKTPLGAALQRFSHMFDALEHLDRESQILASHKEIDSNQALLIHGKRREYAELVAPPSKYPILYMDVPKDLKRSIVSDGRLVNGEAPAAGLAGITLTPEFVETAWINSILDAAKAGYLIFIACLLAALFVAIEPVNFMSKKLVDSPEVTVDKTQTALNRCIANAGKNLFSQEQCRNYDRLQEQKRLSIEGRDLAAQYRDIWTPEQQAALVKEVNVVDKSVQRAQKAQAFIAGLVSSTLLFISLAVCALIFAVAVARMIWIGRFRQLVFSTANSSVDGLRHSWREGLQRWRWRLVDREIEVQNYVDQVRFATEVDRSPLIEIGTSLGLLEARGHLLAPVEGTVIKMSVLDLLQHVEVLGGSGEGKSRNVYVPVVTQLLQLRKDGYPISLYCTDDKGAIGADIVDIAQKLRLPPEDILTIGTGLNDWRVDLLDGLDPVDLADIIKSVAKQTGGTAGDDFWPEAASELLGHVATILHAAEFTEAGAMWVRKNNIRMYSLLNILRVASLDDQIIENVQIIIDSLQNKNDQYVCIAHLDKTGLHASLDYLVSSFIPMVAATKDGITANLRKSLRSFAAKEVIAEGFADGSSERIIPISALLSNKVKIINVSQLEFGSAGRLVSIMLKSLFFRQARTAEQKDPLGAKNKIKWWFNPQPGVNNDKFTLQIFLADEYQALVTSSQGDGISDSSFWNVCRSAGVGGILLSQSVSAFRLAIGPDATENMRRNWRTKIVLRTEDLATIDEIKKLAGKTLRFQSMNWDHMESAVAARRETGICADSLPAVQWRKDLEVGSVLFKTGHFGKFQFPGYQNAFAVDLRFITADQKGDSSASLQAAHWRQEDRSAGVLQHGSSEAETLHEEDIMQMGRGRAVVFSQRAGGTRVEVLKLNS